jgi:hypothetical protein
MYATTFSEIENLSRILSDLELTGEARSILENIVQSLYAMVQPAETAKLSLGQIATRLRHVNLKRDSTFGSGLFNHIADNMLLDLFAAQEQGKRLSVSSLCIGSGGASTTALRKLHIMEERGMIARTEDEKDARRIWVTATEPTLEVMRDLILESTGSATVANGSARAAA